MEEDWVREHLITWLCWVSVVRCWQWGATPYRTDGSSCLWPIHCGAQLSPSASMLFLRESVFEKGGEYLTGGNLREDWGWRQRIPLQHWERVPHQNRGKCEGGGVLQIQSHYRLTASPCAAFWREARTWEQGKESCFKVCLFLSH